MADRFTAAYQAAGGAVTLHKFEGMQHAFINREPDAAASIESLSLIANFITRSANADRS